MLYIKQVNFLSIQVTFMFGNIICPLEIMLIKNNLFLSENNGKSLLVNAINYYILLFEKKKNLPLGQGMVSGFGL